MFSIEEFIIAVFCCVDDGLIEITQIYPIKRRGFAPSLGESEVLTMEVVAEFLSGELERVGINLQTPLRSNMSESRSQSSVRLMQHFRRLIETVIGQLVERFHIEKIREARYVASYQSSQSQDFSSYCLFLA